MGCRCADIFDYREDINKLISAEEHTQTLIGYVSEVRSTLDELRSEYDATLEATGEFLSEFSRLDEGATDNAQGMADQIRGAKQTVEAKLKQAVEEDIIYHKSIENETNPLNPMQLIM